MGKVRVYVSMPEDWLEKLDELGRRLGYARRSELLRDIVRDYLMEMGILPR